jgi:hypothetical protein
MRGSVTKKFHVDESETLPPKWTAASARTAAGDAKWRGGKPANGCHKCSKTAEIRELAAAAAGGGVQQQTREDIAKLCKD